MIEGIQMNQKLETHSNQTFQNKLDGMEVDVRINKQREGEEERKLTIMQVYRKSIVESWLLKEPIYAILVSE
jgi:hypothetical protein